MVIDEFLFDLLLSRCCFGFDFCCLLLPLLGPTHFDALYIGKDRHLCLAIFGIWSIFSKICHNSGAFRLYMVLVQLQCAAQKDV